MRKAKKIELPDEAYDLIAELARTHPESGAARVVESWEAMGDLGPWQLELRFGLSACSLLLRGENGYWRGLPSYLYGEVCLYPNGRWWSKVELEQGDRARSQWCPCRSHGARTEAVEEVAELLDELLPVFVESCRTGAFIEHPGSRRERAAREALLEDVEQLKLEEGVTRAAEEMGLGTGSEHWLEALRHRHREAKEAAGEHARRFVQAFHRGHGWREFRAERS